MFATGETAGLAEWIIDDTLLHLVRKFGSFKKRLFATHLGGIFFHFEGFLHELQKMFFLHDYTLFYDPPGHSRKDGHYFHTWCPSVTKSKKRYNGHHA